MKDEYKIDLDLYGQIETFGNIVCPYCGNEHELDGEYFEGSNEFEDEEFECHSCGKYFKAYARVIFIYSSTTKHLESEGKL